MKSSLFFKVNVFCILFFSSGAFGESIYPKPSTTRPLGMLQAAVGSCESEAQVAALENAFQVRGYHVLLSTFHAHAFNWRSTYHKEPSIRQEYSVEDTNIFEHFGNFVPSYMLPEDARGYRKNTDAGGLKLPRPSVSKFGAYDYNFPSARSTSQSRQIHDFSKSFNVAQIKEAVRSRAAVVLTLQGHLFESYDLDTGLLDSYSMPPLETKGVNHAVALVGFDDDLYMGKDFPPGAFIVRNSWNENYRIFPRASQFGIEYNPSEIKDQEGFQSFRAKINPYRNEVGYFAIPYQYIIDLANRGEGGIRIQNIDYQAFYSAYAKFKEKYVVESLPFFCDKNKAATLLKNYPKLVAGVKSKDVATREKYAKHIIRLSSQGFISDNTDSPFGHAKITRHIENGTDRTMDFYTGAFKKYYCDSENPDFGPSIDIKNHVDYKNSVRRLYLDPAGLGSWLTIFRMFYEYLGEKI